MSSVVIFAVGITGLRYNRCGLNYGKREDVDINEWKMLKTLDGCGPELNAISAFINGLNNDLDSLDAEMDEDEEPDDCPALVDSEEGDEDDSEDVFDEDEAGFSQNLRRNLEEILPTATLILKFLSQSTMMKQPHDVAKCKLVT
jgi:hypothetical protein